MWQEYVFTNDEAAVDDECTNDGTAIDDECTNDKNAQVKTWKDIVAEVHETEEIFETDQVMRMEQLKAETSTIAATLTGRNAENSASSKGTGTPYDDVFRTLLCDCDSLVLPVLNEVFGEHYTGEEKIVHSRNEHYINRQGGEEKERITDSSFKVIGEETKNYLFECQSTPDSSMLVRIFEYATQIALDDGKKSRDKLEVSIPNSAVLYLRSTDATPDKLQMQINPPKGNGIVCDVPIVKLRDYSLDDIFDKNLLFLLPFYIFNYGTKRQLEELEEDEGKLDELKGDYCRIVERLNKLMDDGQLSAYYRMTLLEMSGKVVDGVTAHYERVRKGVREIMGGSVLEYKAKTILLEGYQMGESAGYSKGESAGYSKGESAGYSKGESAGYSKGESAGYSKGESAGYSKGVIVGESRGESKGESKGEIKKARSTANNLFRMNMPIEQIAEAVEVDVTKVKEWLL